MLRKFQYSPIILRYAKRRSGKLYIPYRRRMLSQKSSPVPSKICKWSKLPIEILRLKNAINLIFAYRNFGSTSPINLTSPRLSSAQNTSTTTAPTSTTTQIIIKPLQLQSSTLLPKLATFHSNFQNSKSISTSLYSFTHSRLFKHIPNIFQTIYKIVQNSLLSLIPSSTSKLIMKVLTCVVSFRIH